MPAIAPLIAAGASLLGGGINALNVRSQNRKSRDWSEQMYRLQRSDNIAFWNMQNEYNSPEAQMKRFRSAGLNPLLVYGQGNHGNAGPISTPDIHQAQFKSPEWGNAIQGSGSDFINRMFDWEIKGAQVDNLKARNATELARANLLHAQADMSEFDLGFKSEFREVSGDALKEQVRQMRTNTKYRLSENERRHLLSAKSLEEAAERILSMRVGRDKARAEIKNRELDSDLKRLDRNMRRLGIYPQDPMIMRIMGRLLGPIDQRVKESIQKANPGRDWRQVLWEENFIK
ncbi:hypothetical protein [Eel River basin pequenovirus]|nr:hypothetical protein [Eel River basin pequenovirus]